MPNEICQKVGIFLIRALRITPGTIARKPRVIIMSKGTITFMKYCIVNKIMPFCKLRAYPEVFVIALFRLMFF